MHRLLLVVTTAVYFAAATITACPVYVYTLAQKIEMTNDIFIIEVDDVEVVEQADKASDNYGLRRAAFKVVDVLKGSEPSNNIIESFDEFFHPYCNSVLKANTRYLVLSNQTEGYSYSGCGNIVVESKAKEMIEAIRTSLLVHKPTEMFTGIYIRDGEQFIGDDGTRTKAIDLWPRISNSEMTRVFIEAVPMPSGRLLVMNVFDETELSADEVAVVKEQAGIMDSQIFVANN